MTTSPSHSSCGKSWRAFALSCVGQAPRPPVPAAAKPVADKSAGEILRFQGWWLDLVKRELAPPTGGSVPLTAGEFDLLRVFAQHPNRVLTRAQLIELVKGREWAAYDRAIDTQVGRLRKKLEADPGHPEPDQDGPRRRLCLCHAGGDGLRARSPASTSRSLARSSLML